MFIILIINIFCFFCISVLQQVQRGKPRDRVERRRRLPHGHSHLPLGPRAHDSVALLRKPMLASLSFGKNSC